MAGTRIQQFILVPDRAAARRLRRTLTESGGYLDVVVGTWPELLEAARRAYLLPEASDSWDNSFSQALSAPDTFWSQSLKMAPEDTSGIVEECLRSLLEAVPPGTHLPDALESLPPRAQKHYSQLLALCKKLDGSLPCDLETISGVLKTSAAEAFHGIAVTALPELIRLSPWREDLVQKLNADASDAINPDLKKLAKETLLRPGSAAGALGALQSGLFQKDVSPAAPDDSIQFLGVRDALEEAEIAAGVVQQALDENLDLKPSDFAVLLPSDPMHIQAVRDAFCLAGLPLSGLPNEHSARDLGREAVLNFLLCRRMPAPSMSLASLLSSPLMPWPLSSGMKLAQGVMDGHYELDSLPNPKIARLLSRRNEPTVGELQKELETFASALSASSDEEGHLTRARDAVAAVVEHLKGSQAILWPELFRLCAPTRFKVTYPLEVWQEGIGVFLEHEEPWRRVRHLLVLGFTEGHYPASVPHSPIFSQTDLCHLRDGAGLALETAEEITGRKREIFSRQLQAAGESATFFISRRDLMGNGLSPSQSFYFAARVLGAAGSPESLLVDLDTAEGRAKARGLAYAPEASPQPPRALIVADCAFGRNLLHIRCDAEGNPAPQSPSRLEKLMLSPLAWLLNSAGLTPCEWEPQTLDVLLRGTLAHHVFEHLFPKNRDLPAVDEILEAVPGLLREAILHEAPFLLAPEWEVERRHLEAEIRHAAIPWRNLLADMEARVVGTEVPLTGSWGDLSLRGVADALLSLPGGRLLVVDYKKSKSRARRLRMTRGFDSQASLYRMMLETGNNEQVPKVGKGKIGLLYYLLDDQTSLTDTAGWMSRTLAGIEELGDGISEQALARIRERILEVKHGHILLNRGGEEKWYEDKAGIRMYALDESPLIRLFMHPEMEEETQ